MKFPIMFLITRDLLSEDYYNYLFLILNAIVLNLRSPTPGTVSRRHFELRNLRLK